MASPRSRYGYTRCPGAARLVPGWGANAVSHSVRSSPSSSHCRATDSAGWSGSIAARCASTLQAHFFFEPVQFDLQLADLLVELRLELLRPALGLLPSIGKHLGQGLPELPLPLRHEGGMHPVTGAQLRQRLLFLQRFERYLGFKLGTVVVALCRHDRAFLLGSDTAL